MQGGSSALMCTSKSLFAATSLLEQTPSRPTKPSKVHRSQWQQMQPLHFARHLVRAAYVCRGTVSGVATMQTLSATGPSRTAASYDESGQPTAGMKPPLTDTASLTPDSATASSAGGA
jgi:hypothetical protein